VFQYVHASVRIRAAAEILGKSHGDFVDKEDN
jgi:hypothetical protein